MKIKENIDKSRRSDRFLKTFRKGILFKIGLSLILLTSLVLAIFGIYQYNTRRSREMLRLKASSAAIVERLTVNLFGPLWNYDDEQIEKVIHSEMREVFISVIVVRDPRTGLEKGKMRDKNWNSADLTGEIYGGDLSQTAEIKMNDDSLGTVEVFITTRFMEKELNRVVKEIIIATVILDVLLFVLLSCSIRVMLVRPIWHLLISAKAVAAGDLTHEIDIRQQDEIGDLADAFKMILASMQDTVAAAEAIAAGNLQIKVRERSEHDRLMQALNHMIQRLKEITNETNGMIRDVGKGMLNIRGNADVFSGGWRELVAGVNDLISELSRAVSKSAALTQEMELARRIQTSLLPVSTDKLHPDFEIAASMIPADQVGGDFYDITFDRSGVLWLAIGDVSGHGVTPGLIMMMAQTVHATMTIGIESDARCAVIMTNRILYKNVKERLKENHFMTFTALKYLGFGRFQHAGAHLSMVVFRNETGACELVKTRGIYLNFKKDISRATKNSEFLLNPGDILVLYTDGLTEAENAEGKILDIDGFVKAVEKHAHHNPESMKEMILADVIAWCGGKQNDDMTILIVKRKEEKIDE